jgi:LuxR family maltose regulon positive regulatory protein
MAATKLRPPALPPRLVERARLAEILDGGLADQVPLVLVSAPAGSGKSTLLASWAGRCPATVAWLQVEEADSDPARFWSSVVTAIERVRPGIAAAAMPIVSGSRGDGHVVVAALVNALIDDAEPLVVVVDDYHLIDQDAIHRGVERLVELSPPALTLVLATRIDPPFRLGRMRVRNVVREVRSGDLRFAPTEAPGLLGGAADALDASMLDQLCTRTEGWAAGLVLAGLSLQRAEDPAAYIEAFRGDDQLVVGYLSDELLAGIDAEDRQRLLETAVVDELTGPLVDAITGSAGGARWLADLARRNQLLIRLDTTETWFRYHHLLRELLQLEATRAFPDRIVELRRRAADWFESRGDPERAVVLRLSAGDVRAAVQLLHVVAPQLIGRGQVATLRRLLERIGPTAETSTVCALSWGWCEYLAGRHDAARHWLDIAIAVAPDTFDRHITTALRINVAIGRGDVASALATARTVVEPDLLTSHASELSTAAGAAFAWAGLGARARAILATAVTKAELERQPTAVVVALAYGAVVDLDEGHVAAARSAADVATSVAAASGLADYQGMAPAYAVRARTGTDPEAARSDVHRALDIVRRAPADLGFAYVLTICGDTLLDLGEATGAALVAEARGVVDRCVDPGIVGRQLDRVESRHHLAERRRDDAALVEQLTERELAVLRFLPTQLSQRDISSELYVSLNTVKTHCGAIYRKLGVRDRKSAVQTARERLLL